MLRLHQNFGGGMIIADPTPRSPLSPTASEEVLSKSTFAHLMETVRSAPVDDFSDPTESQPRQKAKEHLPRTAWVQDVARQSVEIKLAGRLQANAVEKYVPDVPLFSRSESLHTPVVTFTCGEAAGDVETRPQDGEPTPLLTSSLVCAGDSCLLATKSISTAVGNALEK